MLNSVFRSGSRRLFKSISHLALLQVFGYLLPLITVPYLYRVLGVEQYGLVLFAAAFMVYFNVLVDFGFNLSAVRRVSIHKEDGKGLSAVFSSVLFCKVFLLGFSFLVLFIVVSWVPSFNTDPKLYLYSFLTVVGQAFFPVWFFQGLEEMKYITIINIVSKTVSVVPVFIFVTGPKDYLLVPLLLGLGTVFGGITGIYLAHLKFGVRLSFVSFRMLIFALSDSATFFLSRVSLSIFTATNTFLIGLVMGNAAVGVFAAADKLYQAYSGLFGTIVQALYPRMVISKSIALWKKVFVFSLGLNFLVVLVLIGLAPSVLALVFSEVSSVTVTLFRVLMFATFFSFPSMLMGFPLLGAWGHVKVVNYSIVAASVFHLFALILLYLSAGFSLLNVSGLIVVSEFLVFGSRAYYCRRLNLV